MKRLFSGITSYITVFFLKLFSRKSGVKRPVLHEGAKPPTPLVEVNTKAFSEPVFGQDEPDRAKYERIIEAYLNRKGLPN